MIEKSVIIFGVSCWGAAAKSGAKKKLNTVIKRASKIANHQFDCAETIHSKACLRKLNSILCNTEHPLNTEFVRSARSNKILQPAARTERFRNSFVPTSVKLLRDELKKN